MSDYEQQHEENSHHDTVEHQEHEVQIDDPEDKEFLARRLHLLYGERIIFVLDDECEENACEWEPGTGTSRLEATANAIRMIIRRKLNASINHTFAVASYNSASRVTWREGFTSDFQALDACLNTLVTSCSAPVERQQQQQQQQQGRDGDGVKLAEVFSQLVSAAEGAEGGGGGQSLTRFVFVYSRSSQVPLYPCTRPVPLETSASTPSPTSSSCRSKTHFLDVLFLHHKLALHRHCAATCQDTLNVLSCLQRGEEDEDEDEDEEEGVNCYLLETHGSNMQLMTFAALLCAHPAHREEQADLLAKLNMTEAALRSIREVDGQARLEDSRASGTTVKSNSCSNSNDSSSNCDSSRGNSSGQHSSSVPPAPPSSGSSMQSLGDAADTVKNMFGLGGGRGAVRRSGSGGGGDVRERDAGSYMY